MTKARDLSQVPNASLGFKNRIINGDMRIAQRGTSATYSGTGQNTSSYNSIDRYSFATFGGAFPSGVYATVAQITDAPTEHSNSLRVTANQSLTIGSSNTRAIWVSQQIEGYNFVDCWNKPITLSFWVKSSNIGTYSLVFSTEGGGYATSYTINSANTWEYKTITITHSTVLGTPNSTNGSGLGVIFGLGGDSTWIGTATANQWVAGNIPYLHGCKNLFDTAGATWQVTGVQLEKGSTATSFDYRPYGTELALCQRYFEKNVNTDVKPQDGIALGVNGTYAGGIATAYGTNAMRTQPIYFAVEKRAAPTIAFYRSGISSSNGNFGYYTGSSWVNASSTGSVDGGQNTRSFAIEIGATSVSVTASYLVAGVWIASAEL
jgi:hypothetical protein